MPKPIKKDSLISEVYRLQKGPITLLKNQENSDMVEVVRCKDCKHLNDNGLCFENINGVGYKKPNPYDFCSYGERKEGDE